MNNSDLAPSFGAHSHSDLSMGVVKKKWKYLFELLV